LKNLYQRLKHFNRRGFKPQFSPSSNQSVPKNSLPEKIVAKLTQSWNDLLFFCNRSLPKKGKKQREENANNEAGNPGEINR